MTTAARLASVAAALVVIVTAVLWLPFTRDVVVQRATSEVPALTFGPAGGSLVTGITFDRVELDTPGQAAVAQQVRLRFTPWGVLTGSGWAHLHADQLEVARFETAGGSVTAGSWTLPFRVEVERLHVRPEALPRPGLLPAGGVAVRQVRLTPADGGVSVQGELLGRDGDSPLRAVVRQDAASGTPEFSLEIDDVSAVVEAPWGSALRGAPLNVTGRGGTLDALEAEAALTLRPAAEMPEGTIRANIEGRTATLDAEGVWNGTRLDGRGRAELLDTSRASIAFEIDGANDTLGVTGNLSADGLVGADSTEIAWRGRGLVRGDPWSVTDGVVRLQDGWEATGVAAFADWRANLLAASGPAGDITLEADGRSEDGFASATGTLSPGPSTTVEVQAGWRDGNALGTVEVGARLGPDGAPWTVERGRVRVTVGGVDVEADVSQSLVLGDSWSGSLTGGVQVPGQGAERFEVRLSQRDGRDAVALDVGDSKIVWSRGPSGRWIGALPAGDLTLFGVDVTAIEDVTWEVGGWPAGALRAELTGTRAGLGSWRVGLSAPQQGASSAWTLEGVLRPEEGTPVAATLSVGPPQDGGVIPLALAGALTGEGALTVGEAGWQLNLAGPQLQARAEGQNWTADAADVAINEVPLALDPWVPLPAAERVTLSLAIAGSRSDAAWLWQPGSWAFNTATLEAAGSVRVTADTVNVEGTVAGELGAALPAGVPVPLEGTITADWQRGTDWRSAELGGALNTQLADVDVAGASLAAAGTVRLTGSLGVPRVDARVDLSGAAEGLLTYTGDVSNRPQGQITANVAWQGRTVELDADLDRRSGGRVGWVSLPGGRWPIVQDGRRFLVERDGAPSEVLRVTLGERWLGTSLAGRLPASVWTDQVAGTVVWSVPSVVPLRWQARWENASVAGARVPDMVWSGGAGGGTLTSSLGGSVNAAWSVRERTATLQGEGLNLGSLGTVGIDAGFDGQAVTGTLTAQREAWSIEATGRYTEGDWFATVASETPHPLALEVTGGGGGVSGSLAGTVTMAGQVWSFAPVAGGPNNRIQTQATGPAGAALIQVDLTAGWNEPAGRIVTQDGRVLVTITPAAQTADDLGLQVQYDTLVGEGGWTASGSTSFNLFGQRVAVTGRPAAAAPTVVVSLPDGTQATLPLPNEGLLTSLTSAARTGVSADLEGAFQGNVRWTPEQGLQTGGLTGSVGGVRVELEGGGTPAAVDIRGTLTAPGGEAPFGPYARFILGEEDVSLRALGSIEGGTLVLGAAGTADGSPFGSARWSLAERSVNARFERAALVVDARYSPARGWTGRLEADGARVPVPGLDPTPVNASLRLEDGLLRGSFQAISGGSFVGTGQVDLPFVLGVSDRADRSDFQVSLASFDVRALPSVPTLAPSLSGVVGARLQLRGGQLLAEVSAPNLRTPNGALPVRLRVSGAFETALDRAEVDGTVAGSDVTGWVNRNEASVWVSLERFPLERLIAARFGAVDAEATAVGVLHAQVPWADVAGASVRLATESVAVRRGASVAEGVMNVEVTPDRADFDVFLQGQGRWSAEGFVARDGIDVRLEVNGSDATPFLGLVPALAAAGVSADGSLNVQASGALNQPRILVGVSDLRLGAYGGRYRIRNTSLRWLDGNLVVDGFLEGIDPLGGSLRVLGRGTVPSWGEGLTGGGFDLAGSLDVPLFGTLEDLQARIEAGRDGTQRIAGQGDLGGPLRLAGTVRPFNLRLEGDSVNLSSTPLRLADTRGAVDATLAWDDGLVLGGRFTVREGRYEIVQDPAVSSPPQPDASPGSPQGETAPLRFDDIVIDVREAVLDESFASGTFAGGLRLSGGSGGPRLQGTLTARQAQLVLLGRTFETSQAEVLFEPSRGVLPTLNVVAARTYRKRDALANTPPTVTIDQPPGATFDVDLAFSTEVVTDAGGALRLDVAPSLSSDAVLRVDDAETETFVTRPLSDGELVTLVSVGRLDPIAASSEGGLAESVASTTLEGTFETLVLRELSGALADATGLSSLAIETTSLGSSLTDSEPFGVSLRIGGALEEGLFASYEFERTFSAEEALTGTTNRFELAYDLDPLSFDAATSVTIPSLAGEPAAVALSTAANYRVTDWTSISVGAELEQGEQRASFGVSFRW